MQVSGFCYKSNNSWFLQPEERALTLGPLVLCRRPRNILQIYFAKHVGLLFQANPEFRQTPIQSAMGVEHFSFVSVQVFRSGFDNFVPMIRP